MTSLTPSPLALNILLAASRSASGVLVGDLVAATVRFTGRSVNAARSRVTGTSRALWRAGYIELHSRRETITRRQMAARAFADRAAASPETFYRTAIRLRGNDPWGSAAACVAAKRAAAELTPRFYSHRIEITHSGRERLAAVVGGQRNFPAGG